MEKRQTETEQIYVFHWNYASWFLTFPQMETLEEYLGRHPEIKERNKEGVAKFLEAYRQEKKSTVYYFMGTLKEWEIFRTKYSEVFVNAQFGKTAVVDAIMFSTLIAYATEYKKAKIIEIMTVLNQLARATIDKLNTVTINQDYERLLHSMLIEMYSNHRDLYTAMFYESQLQEAYESGIVLDFLKQIFTNKYLPSGTTIK